MKKYILTSLLLLLGSSFFAQNYPLKTGVNKAPTEYSQMFIHSTNINTADAYGGIKGSPYLTDDYVSGYVIMNSGEVIENVKIQIDAYAGEIVVAEQEKKIYLNRKFCTVIGYTENGGDKIFKKVNPKKPDVFYEILFERQSFTFFKKTKVVLREESKNSMYKRDAKFNRNINHFIRNRAEITNVKIKKKDFLKQLPKEMKADVEAYLQEHKIKLKKEHDFVKLLEGLYPKD